MSKTLSLLAAALCAAVVSTAGLQPCQGTEPLPAEQAIEEALGRTTEMDFIETPLQEVVDFLKDYHDIAIQFDKKAMDEAGINRDTPITGSIKGISLRSALNLLLREYDLAYTVADEVLLITTPEEAKKRVTIKVYPVGELITRRQVSGNNESDRVDLDYESMIEMITSTVEPASWNEVGGPGAVCEATIRNTEALVILQTYHVHRKIAALLEELREVAEAKHSAAEQPLAKPAYRRPVKPRARATARPPGAPPAARPAARSVAPPAQ
jgi:hypothetical protein